MREILTKHYGNVILSAMTSQITGVVIVCLTICPGTNKKHQSSASLASVRGIHWWPVPNALGLLNSCTKQSKCSHMCSHCNGHIIGSTSHTGPHKERPRCTFRMNGPMCKVTVFKYKTRDNDRVLGQSISQSTIGSVVTCWLLVALYFSAGYLKFHFPDVFNPDNSVHSVMILSLKP